MDMGQGSRRKPGFPYVAKVRCGGFDIFAYTFTGKVLPERTYVSIGPFPTFNVHVDLPEGGVDFDADVVIDTAQVAVVVRSHLEIPDLETLRNSVEHVVRGIVDAFGYIEGRSYDVEITSVIDLSGKRSHVFGVEVGALQATKHERPILLPDLLGLLTSPSSFGIEDASFKPMQLRLAMGDLREAIREFGQSAFFCFRAIECLRQCYVEPGAEDSDVTRRISWETMGKKLCIEKTWIEPVRMASILERHGSQRITTAEQRSELMLRTWKVIDRFILSAKSGFQPLSEDILR